MTRLVYRGRERIGPVAAAPERPTLLYDGQCAFCRRWVTRWRARTGEAVAYEPFQVAGGRFPEIPPDVFTRRMVLVDADGSVHTGPPAVFRALDAAGRSRWLRWSYEHVPGFAAVSEGLYRVVSRQRPALDRIDRWLVGPDPSPSTYRNTRHIFIRLMAAVYLVAFVSLWVQIDGLIGSGGILPARSYLDLVHRALGGQGYWQFPTLLWIDASDTALHVLCGGGVALAVLLAVGVAPPLTALLLWLFYLSLTVAGQVFLGYQWDALLLEAGFLTIFFAPLQLLPRRAARQEEWPRIGLWLLRWLLFRLMFLSGVVKLTWGDPTWADWTAMNYHYETQPLPTWTSWYMHQAPASMQSLSVGFMFYAELIAPWFIFGPRRLRRIAFWHLVLLQLLIAVTGNYGFFNLLTVVLCFTLLDDTSWRRRAREVPHADPASGPAADPHPAPRRWPVLVRRWVTLPVAAVVLLVTLMQIGEAFRPPSPRHPSPAWPQPLVALEESIRPLRSVNSYGLFRTMTTERPEIVVEGSDDGWTWTAYEFKWKPTDPARRPMFATPHMPRLDWQMWFAALDPQGNEPWFVNFVRRLVDGEPAVLDLLATNPFPQHPPKYVRAVLYQYEFADPDTRRRTGQWWTRERTAELLPGVSREDFAEERR